MNDIQKLKRNFDTYFNMFWLKKISIAGPAAERVGHYKNPLI